MLTLILWLTFIPCQHTPVYLLGLHLPNAEVATGWQRQEQGQCCTMEGAAVSGRVQQALQGDAQVALHLRVRPQLDDMLQAGAAM